MTVDCIVTGNDLTYCIYCGFSLSADWQTAGRQQRSSWDQPDSRVPLFHLGFNVSWVTTQSEQYSPISHATLHIGLEDYTLHCQLTCDYIQLRLVQSKIQFCLYVLNRVFLKWSSVPQTHSIMHQTSVVYVQSNSHKALFYIALGCQESKSLHFPAD